MFTYYLQGLIIYPVCPAVPSSRASSTRWAARPVFGPLELCESRGGRPGLAVHNSPYGLCGSKAALNLLSVRAQELCESGGGRLGSPSLMVRTVSVDVKQH